MAIRLLGSATLAVAILNDVRNIATTPFSDASVYEAAVLGGSASFLPLIAAVCVGGMRVATPLVTNFMGHPHGWLRTLSLLVCISAALVTHDASNDDAGLVHTMWHFSTASVIASTVALIRDNGSGKGPDLVLGIDAIL